MKRILILTVCLLAGCSLFAQKYISYGMMNHSIRETMEEHELQVKARNEQGQVLILEAKNQEEMGKIKKTYTEILGRLNKLGLIIDAAFLVNEVYPEVKNVAEYQKRLFITLRKYPQYIPLIAENELYLARQAQSLLNYMTGLTLSAVDIAGMKQGDRMVLLQHVRNEIYALSTLSWKMNSIVSSRIWQDRFKQQQAMAWINREKHIMKDIIKNANDLFK